MTEQLISAGLDARERVVVDLMVQHRMNSGDAIMWLERQLSRAREAADAGLATVTLPVGGKYVFETADAAAVFADDLMQRAAEAARTEDGPIPRRLALVRQPLATGGTLAADMVRERTDTTTTDLHPQDEGLA